MREIIEGFRERDNGIITTFYEANLSKAMKMMNDIGVARVAMKEIYNDAILITIENVMNGKFNESSSLGTYLLGIIKNKSYQHFKIAKHNQTTIDEVDIVDSTEEYNEMKDVNIEKIESKLETLEAKCRELLKRYYYNGEKLKEIGTSMDYTESFIRVKKVRCLKALKAKI